MKAKELKYAIHLEPKEFHSMPAERCKFCGAPTRFWLSDQKTPCCPMCCDKKNQE